MKTYQPKGNNLERGRQELDAEGAVLGRLATKAARYLIGKHKKDYTPNRDGGDFVVVKNAEKIEVTGRKRSQKLYRRHSGYPGGFRELTFEKLQEKHPERIIELAVKRMLPKNRLQKKRLARLKVMVGDEEKNDKKRE